MEIIARNVNQALSEAFWRLKALNLKPEPTRNGPALVFPEMVTTTYRYPQERVLFFAGRDANPIFHLMESIWILAGRRDVAFLQHFNSKIGQFSDDGLVFNAAYGYRIRKHFGHDQLDEVIKLLRRDPATRQAVVQIWDEADLNKKTRDKACLSGTTRFASPEEPHSIRVLSRMFKDGSLTAYPVYGVDIATGKAGLTWMTSAWSNGIKPVLKITGHNGEVLRCTSDHRVWVRRKRFEGKKCVGVTLLETNAGSIAEGDVLLSVKFDVNTNYKRFKRNTFENTGHGNMAHEHKEYAGLLFGSIGGAQVHHLDENTLRNHQNNLCLMTASGHSGYHRIHDNPMTNMPEHIRKFKGEEHRKVLLSRGEYRPESSKYTESKVLKNEPLETQIRIVSIEADGEEEVFDFTVPETHNAATLDGFVVHNCNTQILFDTRGGRLNMTVFNRSNDLWWGAYGANVVHFSILQELVACATAMRMGVYRQVSNNLHLYTELYDAVKYIESPPAAEFYDLYSSGVVRPAPLMVNGEYKGFLHDCEMFCNDPFNQDAKYANPFFTHVAQPMAMVSRVRKTHSGDGAGYAAKIRAEDWRRAAFDWIKRRELAKA